MKTIEQNNIATKAHKGDTANIIQTQSTAPKRETTQWWYLKVGLFTIKTCAVGVHQHQHTQTRHRHGHTQAHRNSQARTEAQTQDSTLGYSPALSITHSLTHSLHLEIVWSTPVCSAHVHRYSQMGRHHHCEKRKLSATAFQTKRKLPSRMERASMACGKAKCY